MAEFDPYGVTQAYTHQSVLTLGAEILTKTLDHEEHERQRAIEDAIELTRLAGEEAKAVALEKLARKCDKHLTQCLGDLRGRCNLAQEEALEKNDGEWEEKLSTAVKFEKDYSDRRLVEQLDRVAKEASTEKDEAVAAARHEEQETAQQQLEKLRAELTRDREAAIAKLQEEHKNTMVAMESRLALEKDRAISEAIASTEGVALDRLTKVKIDHDSEISRYKARVSAEQHTTEQVRLKLEKEVHTRVLAQDRLKDVKEEFKYFINSLPGHENSCYNAEYMISK